MRHIPMLSKALLNLLLILEIVGITVHLVSLAVDDGITDLRDEVVYNQLFQPEAIAMVKKLNETIKLLINFEFYNIQAKGLSKLALIGLSIRDQ